MQHAAACTSGRENTSINAPLPVATAVVFSQGQFGTVKLGRATLFKACHPSEKVDDQEIVSSNKKQQQVLMSVFVCLEASAPENINSSFQS